MNKRISEIEKQLNKILNSAQQSITEAQKKIDQASINEQQTAERVLEALEQEDPQAYAQAVADNRAAVAIAEMYSKNIELKNTAPLISEEEYNKLKSEVFSEINKETVATLEKAVKYLNLVEEARDQLASEMNKADEVLKILQRKVLRVGNTKTVNGACIVVPDDSCGRSEVLESLNNIVDCYGFSSITK